MGLSVQVILLLLPEMEIQSTAFIVFFSPHIPHSRDDIRQSADIIDDFRSFSDFIF